MRRPRLIGVSLVVFFFAVLGAVYAASDELGTISGIVHDEKGKPIAGAKLSLNSDQPPPITMQTISANEGQYRFTGLRSGKYHVAAEMTGIGAAPSVAVEVSAAPSESPVVDFTISPLPSGDGTTAKPAAESRPPLKFEAAGVRGLIDPGGYSAPANAAAASGLIEGIADIKRTGNATGASVAKDWPCDMEPELKNAVAENPGRSEANRRLGEFYLAHNQPERAIPFLQKARAIARDDNVATRDLAVAWMTNGQFDSARQLLTELSAKLPSPETHRLLARAEEGSGKFREASRQYQLAAEAEPSEENLFGVGYELILTGLSAEAARAFEAGLQQHPQSIKLLIGSGTAAFLQGHISEGLRSFLRASDLDPSDPRPYSFLASASTVSQAERERVRSAFKRFLDLAPGNAEASYFYAVSVLSAKAAGDATDTAGVEALLKRAIALDPALAKAHFQLGVLYENRVDYASAALEYETTIRLAPELKEAHYRLAGAYRHTGRSELAAQETQRFQQACEREKSPNSVSSLGIEQFVSVVERPGARNPETVGCPEGPP